MGIKFPQNVFLLQLEMVPLANKPPLENIEEFENTSVYYNVDKNIFVEKTIAIAGGGDSAVDWAIELSSITKNLFYSQEGKIKSSSNSVEKLKKLSNEKNIEMIIPIKLIQFKVEMVK